MNLLDAAAAGRLKRRRRTRGLTNGNAVHGFGTVLAARRLRRAGFTYREIAVRVGAKIRTVQKWVTGRNRATA